MKILIDTSPLQGEHQYRGIGTYTKCLIEALKNLDDQNEYVLTTKSTNGEVDLIHYPFFDLFFLTLPRTNSIPVVVTIHDVIPLIYPEKYPPGIRGRFKFIIQKISLSKVRKIVTDSDISKRDVIQRLGVCEDKVSRVYLAANDRLMPMQRSKYLPVLKKYDIERPFLLYVGDINYNKNISGLIQAYGEFKDKVDLVMVSRAMSGNSVEANNIKQLIEDNDLGKVIHILTNIPYDPLTDLQALYSAASWYIQPSYYEGFGLPVLDAMKCKTPVISSIGGSLKEVIGEAAIRFDPNIKGDINGAIYAALNMTNEDRKALIVKGSNQVLQFSWKKTAKEMVKIYQQALV